MAYRILLVDDEPDILELLAEEMQFVGFETVECSSGNDAVRALAVQHFDIVVSDYKMPNGTGKVVLDSVKKIPENERPIFYFVSGQADMTFEDALNEGVKRFFYKPFDLQELISSLKSDLKKLL